MKDRLSTIESIQIETQEAGVRIIDKTGPLDNPADRDHCLQYMVAIPLIFGRLTASDYEDKIADDPRIDVLRAKMHVKENDAFTKDYFDPNKRYIGNSIQIEFNDGTKTDKVSIDYPVGHKERRKEGIPILKKKFETSIQDKLHKSQWDKLSNLCSDREQLKSTDVDEFMSLLVL